MRPVDVVAVGLLFGAEVVHELVIPSLLSQKIKRREYLPISFDEYSRYLLPWLYLAYSRLGSNPGVGILPNLARSFERQTTMLNGLQTLISTCFSKGV